MMKKANFLAAQDKDCVPEQEQVTVFTATEIAKFKREAFSTFANGKRKYQQAAAYILMLNTGLRTGELLGLLNSDIDLERRVLHLEAWRERSLAAGRPASRTRPGREGWQAEIGHQQAYGTAERHRHRHDPRLAGRSLLRGGQHPWCRTSTATILAR